MERQNAAAWASEKKIQCRKCTRFVSKGGNTMDTQADKKHFCYCGYSKEEHDVTATSNQTSTEAWTIQNDTECCDTNAVGEMIFDGFNQKYAQYIRIDIETNVEYILALMTDVWKLKLPRLVISVTGGAKSLSLAPRLKDVVRKGLIKAALHPDTWIISGGTNEGVMKYVGEAVRYCTTRKSIHIALGVAPWGCVHNKGSLIHKTFKEDRAQYKIEDSDNSAASLDNNHTHFILVDNGTQQKYGVEIPFRAKLEKEIAKKSRKLMNRLLERLQGDDKESLWQLISENRRNICFLLDHARRTERHLLHIICQYDYADVVALFVQEGADTTELDEQDFTPLQVACQAGSSSVVEYLLLDGGCDLEGVPPGMDTSPHYLATRHGHLAVLDKLFNTAPSKAKEMDVRSSLFYAACLSGDLDVVKRWYTPDINLNHPVLLVTQFANCENMTPLQAACSVNSLEVVEFLHESGVELTQSAIDSNPDLIGQLLASRVQVVPVENHNESDSNAPQNKVVANYCKARLAKVHSDWLEPHLSTLVRVNLSNNNLRTLPSCLPWKMPNLEYLEVSWSNLVCLPPMPEDVLPETLRLLELNLSNNKLEQVPADIFKMPTLTRLQLQDNEIKYLYRAVNTDFELMTAQERMTYSETDERVSHSWKCSGLTSLNISNNKLQVLPDDLLRVCSSLTKFMAQKNQLHKFPCPWACELDYMDMSYNSIQTLPSNVSQYWLTSLRVLLLGHNDFDHLPECLVKLNALELLDMSHNKISRLVPQEWWSCDRLKELRLGHNKLGSHDSQRLQKSPQSPITPKSIINRFRRSRFNFIPESATDLQFPSLLKDGLSELHLNDNGLVCIPTSVFELASLKLLNLEYNPSLKTLPKELAKLKDCGMILLAGCSIPNNIVPTDLIEEASVNSGRLLAYLGMQLRECERCNRMKVMVLGKERRGKTTLISTLMGQQWSQAPDPKQIAISEWKLLPSSFKKKKDAKGLPDITLSMWDLPGLEQLSDIHQSFFTTNTLYILVWDLQGRVDEVQELGKWLGNIQSRAPKSTVLIVGTHLDKLPEDAVTRAEILQEVRRTIYNKYSNPQYPYLRPLSEVASSSANGQKITELRDLIYDTALSIQGRGSKSFPSGPVIGRQLPKSYRELQLLVKEEALRRRQQMEPPVLVHGELMAVIDRIPNNDLTTPEEVALVAKFLDEMGDMLHFNDQLRGLNSLYFLDPIWLCDMLAQVTINRAGHGYINNGVIKKTDLQHLFCKEKFPHMYMEQYIQLLERFEIALMLDENRLLIPSKVAKEKFGYMSMKENFGKQIYRFYRIPFLPSGFWTRLITKILVSLPRFIGGWRVSNQQDSILSRNNSSFSDTSSMGSRRSWNHSFQQRSGRGFHLKKVDPIYWREGIRVSHGTGQFVVESAKWGHISRSHDHRFKGILITIQSRNDDFSALGFLVDEIDNLIEDWYKGLEEGLQFALCPECLSMSPELINNPEFLTDMSHFTINSCASICRSTDSIICPVLKTAIPLSNLIPELLLTDLPSKLHLDGQLLKVAPEKKETLLGEGSFGSVYSGTYKQQKVAVKIFPLSLREMMDMAEEENDSGKGSTSSTLESQSSDLGDQTESIGFKVRYYLTELRKEVALLSRLKHPCVLSLIGVCLVPACLVLELAPLGSLRDALDKNMDPDLHDQILSKVKGRVFSSVFSRTMTYKIIFQIAKALQYLHAIDIIYRDLKPDNILVWSLDPGDTVNVKVSDYGISKFSTLQGLAGVCGSTGYQAPEIAMGVAYDVKVDIFSFGVVIWEVLTGLLPYDRNSVLNKIIKAVREGVRPKLQTKEYSVETKLPRLEQMMQDCWQGDLGKRPTANEIVQQISDPGFLCFKKLITGPGSQHGDVHCTLSYVSEISHRDLVWLWEGVEDGRQYHIVDIETGQYIVPQQHVPGPKVTCMTKVGRFIWAGTKASEIEVFGQRRVGVPECLWRLKTQTSPCFLLYQRLSKTDQQHPSPPDPPDMDSLESCEEYVYCGLDDGRLKVFTTVDKNTTPLRRASKNCGWKELKTLTLSRDQSTCSAALVNDNSELWVGCGNTIVIISTKTFLVEQRIPGVFRSPGDGSFLGREMCIQDVISANNRVWCSSCFGRYIMEFDASTYSPRVKLVCLESLQVYDVIATYVTPSDELPKSCANSNDDQSPNKDVTQSTIKKRESEAANACDSMGDEDDIDRTDSTPSSYRDSDASWEDLGDSEYPKLSVVSGSGGQSQSAMMTTTRPPPLPPRRSAQISNLSRLDPVTGTSAVPPQRQSARISNALDEELPKVPPRVPSRLSSGFSRGGKTPPPIPPLSRRPPIVPPHGHRSKSFLLSCPFDETVKEEVEPQTSTLPARNGHPNLHSQKSKSTGDMFFSQKSIIGDKPWTLPNDGLRLLKVKDTLWVGMPSGDILIVLLSDDPSNQEHGKVMAIFNTACKAAAIPQGVTNFNSTGTDTILAVHEMSTQGTSGLVVWEAWGAAEIQRVRDYWIDLRKVEQELSRQSSL